MAAKKVKLRIELVPGILTEDVIIGINGVNWQIPRGKEVEVPDYVAEEYYRSQRAQEMLLNVQESKKYRDPVEQRKER